MTQKQEKQSIVAQYSMLALQAIVLGLTSWTMLTVNDLQKSDAVQTESISNIKEDISDIKARVIPIPASADSPIEMPASSTYVFTNHIIQ